MLAVAALLALNPFVAAPEADLGEVAFRQSLLDLGTDLRLMCVAGHPDDEDGATLAMYRKKYGYKTFAVIATRGEGGQNEIGPELYEELAVIRTREQQGAAEITGADLHFLDLPEFGYSKTLEETLEIWGEEEALRRTVAIIRQCRPDVIITNHGTRNDHGHHQAVGYILREAFDAAADPDVFPEQLTEGVEPWQAARLYLRSWEPTDEDVIVDISELDPWRGKTYAQIAAEALSVHESQGMEFFIRYYLSGRPVVRYRLEKSYEGGVHDAGEIPAPGGVLFEGLHDRVDGDRREVSLSAKTRKELAPMLIARADQGPDWNRCAVQAAQLRLDVTVDDTMVVPGQPFTIRRQVTDFGAEDVSGVLLRGGGWTDAFDNPASLDSGVAVPVDLDERRMAAAESTWEVAEDAAPTIPHAEHVYSAAFLRPQLSISARAMTGDTGITLSEPVYLDIVPPVGVAALERGYLAIAGAGFDQTLEFVLTNYTPGPNADMLEVSVNGVSGMDGKAVPVEFAREDEDQVLAVPVRLPDTLEPGTYTVTAAVKGSGASAAVPLRVVDVELPDTPLNVGVIQSYDDTFVNTLKKLDVPHRALGMADFRADILDRFTTIIIDMRSYLVRDDLVANNQAILDYVKQGGTVICMYQKTFEWKTEYAPYPITVSRNRVTREDAPVEILAPEHPLFNRPNAIRSTDWDGWIQERGLYFPSEWAPEYTPLVATTDPGEDIPPGSLLVADYGEGTYVYTALGWYRQLRELHPGCIRIFANMLAL